MYKQYQGFRWTACQLKKIEEKIVILFYLHTHTRFYIIVGMPHEAQLMQQQPCQVYRRDHDGRACPLGEDVSVRRPPITIVVAVIISI